NTARIPDAFTVTGYFGESSLSEFIANARDFERGIYVIVRPSDPSADVIHEFGGARPLYWHLSSLVAHLGSDETLVGKCGLSCVGAVVAPKDPESTMSLRKAMPRTPFLVPGYGAQGATAADCRACYRASGDGAIINASRSVIYAFEKQEMRDRFGDDWRESIRFAARNFAADVGKSCGR
ncbi:MAG: orotidine 5'-phosphate decarboxylase / HUMPS family protein, partial [Phycisphaerae bacterium]